MATFTERLAILISADGRGAIREIEKVGDTADRELGKAQSASDRWGATFVRSGAMLVGASAVMGVGLFKAAQAFDQAQQAELRLQNSLQNNPRLAGETTAAYLKLANAIQQKTAADGDQVVAGMAMLGTFRVSGQEIRSLTPLVVDYARKFGVDLVSANAAVGKALDGSIGALKRNGVTIDENLYKTDRYAAVTQALRQQVGGFAEAEGKTFSGQLERLKNNLGDVEEAIGGGVVSVLNTMIPLISDSITGFKGLDDATGGTIGKFATFATIGGGAIGTMLLLAGGALKVYDAIGNLNTRMPTFTGAMGQLAMVGGIVGGMMALADALGFFGNISSGVSVDVDTLTNKKDKLRTQLRGLRDEIVNTNTEMARQKAAAEANGVAFAPDGPLSANITLVREKFRDLRSDVLELAKSSPTLAREFVAQAEAAGLNERQIRVLNNAIADAERVRRNTTDATNQDNAALQTNADKIQAVIDLQQRYANANLGVQGAMLNVRSAQEEYNRVLADSESSQLDVDRATNGLVLSYVNYGKAVYDSSIAAKDSVEEASRKQREAIGFFAQTLEPGSPARVALEQYINDLNRIPQQIFTDIVLAIKDEAGDVIASARSWIGKRATGGPVSARTPYIVGENGPELFVPASAGTIVPNGALNRMTPSAAMVGSGTVAPTTLVIPVHVGGRQISEIVVADLNRPGGPKITQKAIQN